MSEKSVAIVRRKRRQLRTRKSLNGTAERPRLAVFRSSKHIYAQLIDDERGVTLASAGSNEPEVRKSVPYGGNKAAAVVIGKLIGERAKAKGITGACFDRRGYRYHGRVAALADAAREAGLQF
jgi:large subunit ribosomal protein L18